MKFRSVVVMAVLGMTTFASATEWTGTMSCGELPTAASPQIGKRVIAMVALQIEGNRAILNQSRHSDDEKLGGRFASGQTLQLEGAGRWLGTDSNRWKVRAELIELGTRFEGIAKIQSLDGATTVSDCAVSVSSNADSSAQISTPSTLTASTLAAQAKPMSSLAGGPTGHLEFMASNPPHRWALIRGQLGPQQIITGDLLMPEKMEGKVPVMVMSHGSDGITSGMHDVWAKPLIEAGYAVFMVDSFTPRNSAKISGTSGQLTWNTTFNISDAIYALKFLSTHPQIDASRIYHMGWSRGGNAVTGAMWPNYQMPITKSEAIKWAGSIALYPGCTLRYRNPTLKIASPVLYLLGEKDDMTPSQPCVEEAKLLAADGQPITYKVYPGAHHVFDRLNQPWRQFKDGTFAKCAVDVVMPSNIHDVGSWGPSFNRATNKPIATPEEYTAAVNQCADTLWVTSESNTKARTQAVADVMNFIKEH